MKKVIFILSVLVCLVSVGSAQAASYEDIAYRKKAISEVKYISSAINLTSDQFIALLELNERRLKDIDIARFYYSNDLDMYEQSVTEINFFYHKKLKAVLNPNQYKIVTDMAAQQPDFVTLAN